MIADFMKAIIGHLKPPDVCPWDLVPGTHNREKEEEVKRAMRRWQAGVSVILTMLFMIVVGSFTTPYGFALAGDTKEQTQKVTEPLSTTIAKIEQRSKDSEEAQRQMLAALNELRAVAVADNLDRLVRRRCIERDSDELQAVRRAIEDNKRAYYGFARREYDEPSCAELQRR